MKTTKRVLAVVLAALMLACMIPFAASCGIRGKQPCNQHICHTDLCKTRLYL